MDPATANIKYFERAPNGLNYMVYQIDVSFRGVSWSISKRFNDFGTLNQGLRQEFPKAGMPELPPKRFFGRFDPKFLVERLDDLQRYIDQTLVLFPVAESRALAEFLEVPQHLDWEQRQGDYGYGGDSSYSHGREVMEQERLAGLVDDTAKALIDISRMGVEPPEEWQVEVQREKLLRACDGFRSHAGHLKAYFQPTLPKGSESVGGQEGLLETLSRPPSVPVAEQQQVLERCGMAVADHLLASAKIQLMEGEDLVCHMQSLS